SLPPRLSSALVQGVVCGDEEVRPAAAGGLELELLEQVVELDVLDRQLEAGVRRDDLVGHDLEGLGLGPGTRAVRVPDRERAGERGGAAAPAARCRGRAAG